MRVVSVGFGCLLIALAMGCGSSDIGAKPCEAADAPADCGAVCVDNRDCATGLYCGADQTCTAECSNAIGCGDGQTCTARGQCEGGMGSDVDGGAGGSNVDGGSGVGGDCPRVTAELSPVVPTVYLLIDHSGSMNQPFPGAVDRWTAVRTALTDPGGAVDALESKVVFGASLYTNDNAGTCPDLTAVAPALTNAAPIKMLLQDNVPDADADTPTGDSIVALLANIAADPPPAESPAIIVLATDGEPDSCEHRNPNNDMERRQAREEAVNGAKAAHDAGIDLFILSVGNAIAEEHLQEMANAGVGQAAGGPQAPFYPANDRQALINAFDTIIRGTRSCELAIDGTVSAGRAGEGTVTINGTTLEYGTDWEVVDSMTLRLLGAACDTLLNENDVTVSAEFPCGVIID